MFSFSIYIAAVVSDDGGVRTLPQSPACFVSYKSWLSVHGTCNEGKHGEILSNLCGQFSEDITGLCYALQTVQQRQYMETTQYCCTSLPLDHIITQSVLCRTENVFVCLQIENPG